MSEYEKPAVSPEVAVLRSIRAVLVVILVAIVAIGLDMLNTLATGSSFIFGG